MMRLTLALLALVLTPTSYAQMIPYEAGQLREQFAKVYARDFAAEFNEMSRRHDLRDIYQYFLPPNERAVFFDKFKIDRVEVDGPNLIVRRGGKIAFKVQVVDVLGERFAVNGASYTHDWTGNPATQREVLRRIARGAGESHANARPWSFDFGLPRAEANPLLIPLAVQACVDGGCALAWFIAQRGAIWAVTNSGRIAAVTAASSPAIRKAATEALQKAGAGVKKVGEYIWNDIKNDPELSSFLGKVGKGAISPAAYIKAPFKAAGWFGGHVVKPLMGPVVGMGGGVYVLALNQKVQDGSKLHLDALTSLKCGLNAPLSPIEECAAAKPKVTVADTPPAVSVDPAEFWCPTSSVNEFQYAMLQKDGSQVTSDWRVSTDEKTKGAPIMALRYETDQSGKVRPDSVRYYEFEAGKVILATKLKFASEDAAGAVVTRQKRLPDPKLIESDLKDQITRRDVMLKAAIEDSKKEILLTDVDVKKSVKDPLQRATDPKAIATAKEIELAREMENGLKPDGPAKICDLRPAAPPAAVSDAGLAMPDALAPKAHQ